MNAITIDSSHMDEVTVSLAVGEKTFTEKKQARNIKGSQVILQTIDELLKKHSLAITGVDAITTHPGPGSYTGLRVGAAIANTLAFCLETPINEKPRGEFVYPTYE